MDPIAALDHAELALFQNRTAGSRQWFERARRVMPGGDTRTGTFHLPYPLFISKGHGGRVTDADGHEYLDFVNNFTSLLHGHAHPAVHEAVVAQEQQGTVHGTANGLQVELAEVLSARVPSVERIRFCNSGTEATLFALRAAKAFTGKAKIMKMEGGYHGSHDQVAVAMAPPYNTNAATGLSPGALNEVILGSFNDLDETAALIRKHRHELAAVIVEPMLGAAGAIVAEPEFLAGLRAVTSECGVLLVLDEIITFRLEFGGLQERYGLRPDLTTFGKIIGGGFPVGAFGGRADVMATYDPTRPGAIVHSGTYNGNAVTMVAGLKTLDLFDREAVSRLNQAGDDLRHRLQGILDSAGVDAVVAGTGSVCQLHFMPGPLRNARDTGRGDRRLLRLMHLSLANRGVFTTARQMYVLSTAMTPAILDQFAGHFAEALGPIAEAVKQLTSMAGAQ